MLYYTREIVISVMAKSRLWDTPCNKAPKLLDKYSAWRRKKIGVEERAFISTVLNSMGFLSPPGALCSLEIFLVITTREMLLASRYRPKMSISIQFYIVQSPTIISPKCQLC